MTLRYVFSELKSGLRRNLTMHLAVILTLFVSLTLAGCGILLQREAKVATDTLGSSLQILVNLCAKARIAR
jgi:cell division transport system permease protein